MKKCGRRGARDEDGKERSSKENRRKFLEGDQGTGHPLIDESS